VLFLNRSEAASDIRVNWSSLGLKTGKAKVRDLWAHSDLGVPVDGWTAKAVPPHGVVMLIVQGEYDWDRSRSYEAESSYNTFAGLARQRCKLTGFSSTAGVVGVGNGKDHSLQFNRMAAPTAGPYTLDIFYACNGERHAEMSVNGKETMPIVFPATGNDQLVGMVTVEVSLQAGEGNAIRFANTSGPAPVFDRIRIRPSGSVLPVAEAKLLRIDDNTKGHWQSIFGKSGFTIPGGPVTTSDLATVACEESIFVWAATTDDRRALNTGETNKGIASCRYDPNQISVGVSVAAGKMAQVALYVCDWTREKRAMRVSVIDQGTWIERCSADVAQFDQGRWLVFQVKGDVQFRLTKTEGTNVVLGGVFIDPVIP